MQVRKEQIRQSWLTAMGLTPWVAKARLPGAAKSCLVKIPDVAPAATDTQITTKVSQPKKPTSLPNTDTADTNVESAAAVPPNQEASATPTPTLAVYQAEKTLLIATQGDRYAPGLSRDEQQLLNNLLQLFGQQPKSFSFLCPAQPDQARETLTTFTDALAQQGVQRILFCLDAASSEFLLNDQPRFQPFNLSQYPALVISSLAEMLDAPLPHKKDSWYAICEAGFDS